MVKGEEGLHDVGNPVGAASELPQEAPALEGGHGPLAEAADPGVGGVVAALPSLEAAASKRYPDSDDFSDRLDLQSLAPVLRLHVNDVRGQCTWDKYEAARAASTPTDRVVDTEWRRKGPSGQDHGHADSCARWNLVLG